MFNKPLARLGSAALSVFLIGCAVFFLAASGGTQKSARDRILYAVDSARTAGIRGTAHPLARPQFDRGRVSPDQQLSNVALTFRLSPAQQSDLQELLREQQDRSSPNYHKWLTPDQYAARFGMTPNDLAKVTSWLQSQGLTVNSISRNRNEISFSGSVGAVEYALKTEMHRYMINGEEHITNASDVALPEAFAGEALGVRGLNDFHPKPRLRKPLARFTSNLSGLHNLIPGDFAKIYDLPSNFDGTGQTIAVVGQTLISTTDIDAFRSAAGLPARTGANFQQIQVPSTGTALKCHNDELEADLDLEWSEGVAKNATIKFVYAGVGSSTGTCANRTRNAFDALQYAITNNVAPIISISYGNCEANLPRSFVLTMQQWAQQANAQGQTISGPSGDSGAADCDTGTSSTQGFAVDVPASIPEVTGVGGTEFTGDADACPPSDKCPVSGAPADSPYWSGSTSLTSGASAQQYIPEKTWDDSAVTGGLDAGGGGASTIFAKPSWQSATGIPGDGKRDVPDIALNGSANHDGYLICSEDDFYGIAGVTSCANGFRSSSANTNYDNRLERIGGTSAGAPTFAGILALINQATGSSGLGNVNPMLYSLAASSPAAFHDITSGNNNVPCTAGTANCPTGTTSIGFSAGTGYDRVTGLGSVDVSQLISAWTAVTPTGDFSLEGLVTSAAAPGQAGTSSVTVTALSGFTGTVNLTCSSSSSKVSCSLNPASVTFPASRNVQSSTLSVTGSADLRLAPGLPSQKSRFETAWLAVTGFGAMGGVLGAVLLGGIPLRKKWLALFGLVLLAIAVSAIGCGGGGNSSVISKIATPQTYIVTVTGTGTNGSGTALTHSTAVSFTVQ